jgi:hypothetical protein
MMRGTDVNDHAFARMRTVSESGRNIATRSRTAVKTPGQTLPDLVKAPEFLVHLAEEIGTRDVHLKSAGITSG